MDPWITIFAAVAGSAVVFAGNLATEFVRDWLTARREKRARTLAGIEAALSAMKDIGERAQQALIYPPWWPSLEAIRPAREFAYEVAGAVQDETAVDGYLNALNAVWEVNSSLGRAWTFRTWKLGLSERLDLAKRLGDAEAKVAAAAVKRRDSVK